MAGDVVAAAVVMAEDVLAGSGWERGGWTGLQCPFSLPFKTF